VGLRGRWTANLALLGSLLSAAPQALAQPDAAAAPAEESAPDDEAGFELPDIAVHGFVSQGAFVSTENDYLGHSERGSVEFLEAAINVSTEVAERLRVGAQLFTRDLGPLGNYAMSLDWAYLDYRWRDWLGLRAGRVKMPFGLYNEFSDIDSARLPILLPQSVYPIASRDFLLAQTGVALYGSYPFGSTGGIDYQIFGGTIFISQSSVLNLDPAISIREIDTKQVGGGQLFWRTPLAGLRLGGSYLHTTFDFHLQADAATTAQLIMLEVVPPDFDGRFVLGLRDIDLAVGSVEYVWDDWLFAAEYSRWMYDVYSSIPDALPVSAENSERFYGMVAYRFNRWLEAGSYYSVSFVDADDRDGSGERFREKHRAYQRDLAMSARFDVNDFWLWKLEAHYMDGTGYLSDEDPADPNNLDPDWGFFLVKTTVSF
jgi:hypothetical protein